MGVYAHAPVPAAVVVHGGVAGYGYGHHKKQKKFKGYKHKGFWGKGFKVKGPK